MDISDRLARFDSRFNVQEKNEAERFESFLASVHISFQLAFSFYYKRYCNDSGIDIYRSFCKQGYKVESILSTNNRIEWIALFILEKRASKIERIRRLQVFIWTLEENNKLKFVELLKEDLETSRLDLQLIELDGDYEFVPKGAEELDDPLVNDMFVWLEDYPIARKNFANSLKLYMQAEQDREESSVIASLNEMGKALEQFLKAVFNPKRGFKKLKGDVGTYLEERGVAEEIRNLYMSILNYYEDYQNDKVKHKSIAKANEIEFILYQTGSLIRFLIQLKREEEAETA